MHTEFRMFSVIWKISNAFCNLVIFCFVGSRNKSHTETWRGFCCYNFHSWCNTCPSSNFEDSKPGIGQMLINFTFTMNVLGSPEKVGMMGICPNLYHQLLLFCISILGGKSRKPTSDLLCFWFSRTAQKLGVTVSNPSSSCGY